MGVMVGVGRLKGREAAILGADAFGITVGPACRCLGGLGAHLGVGLVQRLPPQDRLRGTASQARSLAPRLRLGRHPGTLHEFPGFELSVGVLEVRPTLLQVPDPRCHFFRPDEPLWRTGVLLRVSLRQPRLQRKNRGYSFPGAPSAFFSTKALIQAAVDALALWGAAFLGL